MSCTAEQLTRLPAGYTSIEHTGADSYTIVRDNGQTSNVGFNTTDPATLRARADDLQERAARLLRAAADARAIADLEEVKRAQQAAEAAEQRNSRAAATRARNADPFGYNYFMGEESKQ